MVDDFFGIAEALRNHLDPPPIIIKPFESGTSSFFSTLWGAVEYDRKNILRTLVGTSGRILDVGSGGGRLVTDLAASGFQAVGVELSPAMHAHAVDRVRSSAPHVRENVRLVCGDFRDLNLRPGSLAGVTSIGLTVPTFSNDLRRDLLKFAARSLEPGGIFAFDLLDVDDTEYVSYETLVHSQQPAGNLQVVLIECVHDPAGSGQLTNLVFQNVDSSGHSEYRICSLRCRLPRRAEFVGELTEAGFQDIRTERIPVSEFSQNGASATTWDLTYVTATKSRLGE